jgi:hypothetical protein
MCRIVIKGFELPITIFGRTALEEREQINVFLGKRLLWLCTLLCNFVIFVL